jgi:hypothetical protein
MKLSRIPEYITIAMVFVVGVIAVLVFFFDTIQSAWFPEEVDLMRFIAASMGTILVALGIERVTIFARQESKFDGIKQLAMKSIQDRRSRNFSYGSDFMVRNHSQEVSGV